MENWFKKMFIDEAKAALSKNGGGNLQVPTKLSDLENDIFGSTRTPAASWTKDDFFEFYNGVMVTAPFDIGRVTSVENLGYSVTASVGSESMTITETTAPLEPTDDYEYTGPVQAYLSQDAGFYLIIGENGEPENEIYGDYVTLIFPLRLDDLAMFSRLDITLYYKNTTKIPVEWVETSDLEAAIVDELSALEDEVNNA